jgi:hypothetical protein
MNNWEKKSAYLLREIVKFRTYIDSLAAAQTQKDKLNKEREAAGVPKIPDEHAQASNTTTNPTAYNATPALLEPKPLLKTNTT